MMNYIINTRSGLLAIKLYSSPKLIKYSLRASGKFSLLNFPGKGKLRDPIARLLCNNFCNACKVYCK